MVRRRYSEEDAQYTITFVLTLTSASLYPELMFIGAWMFLIGGTSTLFVYSVYRFIRRLLMVLRRLELS